MATGIRTRDWATVDFYAVLGVDHAATGEDVTRAYRTLAKQLHPDAQHDDPGAEERFKDLVAAYRVLGDRRARRDYDRVRAEAASFAVGRRPAAPAATAGAAASNARRPWSPRRVMAVTVAGVLFTVLGLGVAILTWSLHDRDAAERSRFVPVTATRVDVNGRNEIEFRTETGRVVDTIEPQQHGDPVTPGETVRIRYDPANPAHVITDSTTFGRDITLAIVALKLLVGGPIFVVYARRRARPRPRPRERTGVTQ